MTLKSLAFSFAAAPLPCGTPAASRALGRVNLLRAAGLLMGTGDGPLSLPLLLLPSLLLASCPSFLMASLLANRRRGTMLIARIPR